MLDGQGWTRTDGHEHVYVAGEPFNVSPGVRRQNRHVVRDVVWAARGGKTNGVPGLPRAALLLHEHHDEFRPGRPLAFL